MNRGYFGIGIENPKTKINLGTLWRSAYAMEASFIFTIGQRYQKQRSDTPKAWKHVPLYNYKDLNQFLNNIPYDCSLIGIETGQRQSLTNFVHPERCIYLLGAENIGLSKEAIEGCTHLITIPGCRTCLNVAVSGSIIMADRVSKGITI